MAASYVVIDIETADAPPEALSAAIERYKVPASIKDPKKREIRQGEMAEKIIEKSALLDSAPIIAVAVKTNNQAVLFQGMSTEAYPVDNWTVLGCGDERTMLWAFGQWANAVCDENTTVVGHCVLRFDLPRLRGRSVWYRLPLPGILDPGQPACDSQRMFKYFSTEHYADDFVALDTVCAHLGLPRKRPLLNGSDIPRLYREGQYSTIVQYNCLDAALTEAAFLLMAG